MLRYLFFAALAAIATNALGDAPSEARFVTKQWSAHCKASFGTYALHFESASGDPTQDDMAVLLKVGATPAVTVPLKQALFVYGRLASKARSQCDNLSAVTLASGNILVFIQRDDRPSEDRVGAILLHGQDGALLDVVGDLGSEAGLAVLSTNAGAVRIKLIRKWKPETATAEAVPTLAWLRLGEIGGKIQSAWE